MFPLDPRTIERLCRVIVDPGSPYERAGWQLEQLLAHAGWSDPPEYDGSFKIAWLYDQITARQNDRVAIERLLCRVCDPLEYDDGMADAETFRQEINKILEPERLAILYTGGRPVLSELDLEDLKPRFTEPPELERRIAALIEDEATVQILTRRAQEARICANAGAHTMAIIGIGSFVEGLLYALLNTRDKDAQNRLFVNSDGEVVKNRKPNLELLIDTAHAKGWIQLDAKKFIHQVRDFRNYVHPRRELLEQPDFDSDSVQLCWMPVQAMLNDLEARLPS